MSPAEALSAEQRHAVGRIVQGLARQNAIAYAIQCIADAHSGFSLKDRAQLDAAATALGNVAILADAIDYLSGDVNDALEAVFEGISWRFDHPGYPKAVGT